MPALRVNNRLQLLAPQLPDLVDQCRTASGNRVFLRTGSPEEAGGVVAEQNAIALSKRLPERSGQVVGMTVAIQQNGFLRSRVADFTQAIGSKCRAAID